MPTNQQGRGLNTGGLRSGGVRRVSEHATGVGYQLIDSFEDGDLAEYTDYEDAGGTSAFNVLTNENVQAEPINGEYFATLNDYTSYPKAISTSGLGAYPSQGDEWSVWVSASAHVGSADANADQGIYFGAQDLDNNYYINIRWHDDLIRLYEKDAGTATGINTAQNIGLSGGKWYKCVVRWDDGSTFGGVAGDITFRIEDAAGNEVASISGNSTLYTSGGFGLYGAANGSERLYWDYATISGTGPAGEGSHIDDFEDGDLVEYDYEAGNGTAGIDLVSSPVHSGDFAASVTGDGSGIKAVSNDGLEFYPRQGDEFEVWFHFDGTVGSGISSMVFYFGWQDSTNNYYMAYRPNTDDLEFAIDGTVSSSAASVGLTAGEYHRLHVQWDDGSTFGGVAGDLTITLEDSMGNVLATLTDNDTQYSAGGWGYYVEADTGETLTWDAAEVLNRDTPVSTGTIESFESGSFTSYSVISDEGRAVFNHTDPKSDYEAIGGGPGYPHTISESEAHYTVSTSDDLRTAALGASPGEIIYVTGDITSIAEQTIEVPAGVTVAGDRGIDGSPGPLIEFGKRNRGMLLGADCRFTGIRVQGPWPDDWSTSHKDDDDYHQKGINFNGDNAEIDNCEVYGFGYSCVQLTDYDAGSLPDGVHAHHNNIHHGIGAGWGYGIDTYQATDVLIEHNRFAHCRHAITGAGEGSYTARHNILEEPHTHNIIDMHQMGGIWTDVRRNTVVTHRTDIDGLPTWNSSNRTLSGYIQREAPDLQADVYNNWFWNPHPPQDPPYEGFSYHAIDQAWPITGYPGEWQGVNFGSNQYGADTTAPEDRRARDGRRCRDEGERCLVYYGSRSRRGLLSTSGLENYPAAGDTWRFFFRWEGRPANRGLAQVFFGVQSETEAQNYYEIEFRPSEIALEVDNAGDDTRLLTLNHELKAMIPYEVEVDWPADPSSQGITITIRNHYSGQMVASGTATPDGTFITGGIGFYGNSWSGFLLDDFEIL